MTEVGERLIPVIPDDASTSRTLAAYVVATIIVIGALWGWQVKNLDDVDFAVRTAQMPSQVTISAR